MNDNVQIRKIYLACFTSSFGSSMLNFALSFFILQQIGSAIKFGILRFAIPLFCIFIAKYILLLIHKYPGKKILLGTQLISIFALITYAILQPTYNQYLQTLILLVILAFCDQLFSITYESSIHALVETQSIAKLKKTEEIAGSISLIASPLVAGLFLDWLSLPKIIIITIIFEFTSLLFIQNLHFKEMAKDSLELPKEKQKIEFKTFSPQTKYILYIFLVASLIGSLVNISLPYVQIRLSSFNGTQFGLTKSAWAIGMLLSSLCVQEKAYTKLKYFYCHIPFILSLLPLLLLKLSLPTFYFIFLVIIFNLTYPFLLLQMRVNLNIFLAKKHKQTDLARIKIFQKNSVQLCAGIGGLVFSFLFEIMSYNTVIILFCSIFVLIALSLNRLIYAKDDA